MKKGVYSECLFVVLFSALRSEFCTGSETWPVYSVCKIVLFEHRFNLHYVHSSCREFRMLKFIFHKLITIIKFTLTLLIVLLIYIIFDHNVCDTLRAIVKETNRKTTHSQSFGGDINNGIQLLHHGHSLRSFSFDVLTCFSICFRL